MYFVVPGEPPQNVQCSPLTAESLRMSWDPPPVESHHGTILGYKIQYKKVNPVSGKIIFIVCSVWISVILNATIDRLICFERNEKDDKFGDKPARVRQIYKLQRKSLGLHENWRRSAIESCLLFNRTRWYCKPFIVQITITIFIDIIYISVPGSPDNVKALTVTSSSILVSWTPPKQPNGVIVKYTVHVKHNKVRLYYNIVTDNAKIIVLWIIIILYVD